MDIELFKNNVDLSTVITDVRFGTADGESFRVTFANGYGVSVLRNFMSYGHEAGLWELAVLKDDSICHDTPITSDVIGWLRESDVIDLAKQVARL